MVNESQGATSLLNFSRIEKTLHGILPSPSRVGNPLYAAFEEIWRTNSRCWSRRPGSCSPISQVAKQDSCHPNVAQILPPLVHHLFTPSLHPRRYFRAIIALHFAFSHALFPPPAACDEITGRLPLHVPLACPPFPAPTFPTLHFPACSRPLSCPLHPLPSVLFPWPCWLCQFPLCPFS